MAFPGLLITAATLIRAIRDYRSLRRSGHNGALRMVARNALRREWLHTVKHVLLAASILMLLPRLDNLVDSNAWWIVVLRNAFVAMTSLIIGIEGLLDLRSRRKLLSHLIESESSGR